MRKLPLTCPEPSHPGVGQDMPSVLTDFQENWEPLRYPSFCRLAAKGQPEALRWEAYFPVMWPWPSQPGTGHLRADTGDPPCCLAATRHMPGGLCSNVKITRYEERVTLRSGKEKENK